MEKDVFMRYVQLLHRFEELSKEEHSIYSNTIEAKTILEVRQLVGNNQELLELLKKIHSLPDSEREKAVEEYFSKQNKKEEQEEPKKSEEEEIAKTFEVNVNEIDHKYLKNGNEIFSFYDRLRNSICFYIDSTYRICRAEVPWRETAKGALGIRGHQHPYQRATQPLSYPQPLGHANHPPA